MELRAILRAALASVAFACVVSVVITIAPRAEAGESRPATRPVAAADPDAASLKQGEAITINGDRAVLTRLDSLPYVESEYTKLFKFDAHDNPRLKDLRERYHLDEVVASGKDD